MFNKNKGAQQSNLQPGSTWATQFCSVLLENFYMTSVSVCMDVWRMSVNTSTFICLVNIAENMRLFIICYSHQMNAQSEQYRCQMPITQHEKQIIKTDRW